MFPFSFKATNLKFSKGNSHLRGFIKIVPQILSRTSVVCHGGDGYQIYLINYFPEVTHNLNAIQ